MKIELESTGAMASIDGQPCRVWKGVYQGADVVAFVRFIAVADGGWISEDFARELLETAAPVGAVDAARRAIR